MGAFSRPGLAGTLTTRFPLPSAFTSVAMLLEGVAAVFLAWIILSEAPGGWQIVGACVVLGGIVVARRGSLCGVKT